MADELNTTLPTVPDAAPEPAGESGMSIEAMSDSIVADMGMGVEEETGEEGVEEVKEPSPAPEKAAEAEKPEAATPPATTVAPPSTWSAAAKEKWATMDPAVQAEVLKREEDVLKGITQYKGAAQVGTEFFNIVAPHGEYYKRAGVDVWNATKEAVDFHALLSFGSPQQKMDAVRFIAEKAGIDLSATAQGAAPVETDRIIHGLTQQVQALRDQLGGVTGEIQTQQLAKLEASIDDFAADPKNVYFWEVAEDIARLFDAKQAKTLQEAYDKAVWLNPMTRAKEVDRKARELAEKTAEEARKKGGKARAAARVNVRSSESAGRSTSPVGSIDDTLRETLAEINSR